MTYAPMPARQITPSGCAIQISGIKASGYQPSAIPEAQISRQRKKAQAQRDVVVHESHLERPAVGENRDERRKLPGRAPRRRGDEGKGAPEKRQYRERHGDFFGNPQAEGRSQPAQEKIEKNVVPLPRDPQPGGVPLPDQLREPRIIEMAGPDRPLRFVCASRRE